MERVIVTGADGFIGSSTTQQLLGKGIEVVAIDLAKSPRRLKAQEGLRYLNIDVGNKEKLEDSLRHYKCDTWYHFAWQGVERKMRKEYEITINNAINTVNCIKVAKNIGCNRFIGVGSICEKEVIASLYEQSNHMEASSYYGIGKLLAHLLSKVIAEQVSINYVCGVIANTYGIGGGSAQFINRIISQILLDQEIDCTEADQDYDFVYITDVAEAFYLLGENGKPGYEYIIGSSEAKPLREFLHQLEEEMQVEKRFKYGGIAFKGGRIKKELYDIGLIQQDTGFSPKVSFREGIRKTIEWEKEKRDR